MKYMRQFAIILAISFLGEALRALLPLQVPGSIYGIVLLFACLCLKVIPLDAVKDAGHFLIEIMPMLFIPATAGLLDAWPLIRSAWFPYLFICLFSTILVIILSGRATQRLIRLGQRGGERK